MMEDCLIKHNDDYSIITTNFPQKEKKRERQTRERKFNTGFANKYCRAYADIHRCGMNKHQEVTVGFIMEFINTIL